jgi:uncharacterized cupredoxin-like copper-binding protein
MKAAGSQPAGPQPAGSQPAPRERSNPRRVRLALVLGAVVVACGSGLTALAASAWSTPAPAVRTITIAIHYSHFFPSVVQVRAGSTVRFIVRNTDPIDHEFIVGNEALQAQEEVTTETVHSGNVPGQISVPAGTTRSTTVTIPAQGPLIFACHLPGHYAYGMRGTIQIVSRP